MTRAANSPQAMVRRTLCICTLSIHKKPT
jgi:hypothetical protein